MAHSSAMRPLAIAVLLGCALFIPAVASAPAERKILVAHRGASAYAPEHTAAAYELAIAQGADYVEQDLQITRDRVLVCLHDSTLERTTDVEARFPERAHIDAQGRKNWPVSDFTLSEIKTLDAGSWFGSTFAGARVPTWQEAIDLIRGRAGLYPETKAPDVYASRGFDMEALVMAQLVRNHLDQPGADPRTPVILQSFSAESLRRLQQRGVALTRVFLISDGDPGRQRWLTEDGLGEVTAFAQGIGPAKALVTADPTLTRRAHALGLTVTPYTFGSSASLPASGVRDEMDRFLYTLGVDGLFTNNPDQFPRR